MTFHKPLPHGGAVMRDLRTGALTTFLANRPDLSVETFADPEQPADPSPTDPAPQASPATCLLDAERFWALEDRIKTLEDDVGRNTPPLAQLLISAMFGALFTVGCLAAVAAFAVALPWAWV